MTDLPGTERADLRPGRVAAAAILISLTGAAPNGWVLTAWSWTALLGIALAVIDATVHRLPDVLTAAAGIGVLTVAALGAVAEAYPSLLLKTAAGAAVLGGLYTVAVVAGRRSRRPGMDRGGAALAVPLGGCLGAIDPGLVAPTTALTVLAAGLFVAGQVLTGRLKLTDRVAFGRSRWPAPLSRSSSTPGSDPLASPQRVLVETKGGSARVSASGPSCPAQMQ